MNKDNEIYVTSNGELYKKGVEQAIYPQTNYTTQQFYTKEEYDKLQAENEQLKADIESRTMCITCERELQNYNLQAENERLKKEIKYLEEEKKEKIQLLEQIINILYPNANDDELFTITFNSEYIDKLKKYRQALQEIRDIAERQLLITNVRTYQMVYYADFFQYRNEILAKINEVIGVE